MKPIVGEVDVKDLLSRLAFAEEDTQRAALEQAKLFMAAATYRIRRMKERQQSDAAYDDIRTEKSIRLRVKGSGGAKKGFTEKSLTELVDRDPAVKEARDAALAAKRREEWAKLLLDAYEHRRSTIKVLVQFAYIEDTFRPSGEVDSMKARREKLKRSLPDKEEDFV